MSKTFKNLLGLVFLALFGFGMYQGSESDARRDAFNAFIGAANPHITASDALVDRNANLSKDHPDQSQEFFLAEMTAIVAESRSILEQFKSIATDDAEIVAMRDQLTPYFASRHEYYEALLAMTRYEGETEDPEYQVFVNKANDAVAAGKVAQEQFIALRTDYLSKYNLELKGE